jgi:ABC-type glycerol-3-phosphate transport system permease component
MRTAEGFQIMAVSTLVTLPLILILLFARRYFIQGVKMSGIKG